jgi:hypothetical protein
VSSATSATGSLMSSGADVSSGGFVRVVPPPFPPLFPESDEAVETTASPPVTSGHVQGPVVSPSDWQVEVPAPPRGQGQGTLSPAVQRKAPKRGHGSGDGSTQDVPRAPDSRSRSGSRSDKGVGGVHMVGQRIAAPSGFAQ